MQGKKVVRGWGSRVVVDVAPRKSQCTCVHCRLKNSNVRTATVFKDDHGPQYKTISIAQSQKKKKQILNCFVFCVVQMNRRRTNLRRQKNHLNFSALPASNTRPSSRSPVTSSVHLPHSCFVVFLSQNACFHLMSLVICVCVVKAWECLCVYVSLCSSHGICMCALKDCISGVFSCFVVFFSFATFGV